VRLEAALAELSARFAAKCEIPALEAQVLMAHVLQKSRAWVLAHPESELSPAQQLALERSAARRQKGEPLPYILGHWELYGLDLLVTPAVLIPRPETELLVERALDWLRSHPNCRWAADIGTGSGCIAIALAVHIPDLKVLATDLSPQALQIANNNAIRHGVAERITFLQADLLALPVHFQHHPFDLIASNLPYIPHQTLEELPVSQFEPFLALDGGEDGLDLIHRLVTQAPGYLSPHGCLLLEIEARQGEAACALTKAAFPQAQIQLLPDLAGHDRLVEVDLSKSNHRHLLVHLCTRSAWSTALQQGSYQAESLAVEGFIHLSRPDQILKVANAFYRGLQDAILLWIDPARLQAALRWEAVDADVFPHLYGALNLDAVKSISDLIPDQDGVFRRNPLPFG
jgi:release factor glutamine methyltransferase